MNDKLIEVNPRLSDTQYRIIEFLESNGVTEEYKIAEATHLHPIELLNELLELERKGLVIRLDDEPMIDDF